MIKIKNLFVSYTNKGKEKSKVLDDIDFNIEKGKFISVLGPSGCGKTTLIRSIAGLIKPSGGEIYIDNTKIEKHNNNISVIFQEYGLFEWKTVKENIEFGLIARKLEKEKIELVAKQYIKMVHLEGSENKYPNQLSGGMKQRAAIARAFAVNPDYILMDEPFSALDSQTRSLLQEEILEIWEQTKKTILMVTHNIEEAIYLSDRVIVLSRQPARILLDIDISIARPRTRKIRHDEEFVKIYDILWDSIRNEIKIN